LNRPPEPEAPMARVARLDLSACAGLDTADKRACFSEAAAGRALELAGAWVGAARDEIPGCGAVRSSVVAVCTSAAGRQQAANMIGDAIVEAAIEVVAGCRDLDDAPWDCVEVAAQRVRMYSDTADV